MSGWGYLGNFELMVLLAVIRLGDTAYGVTISRALEESTRREVALGSVYAALDRLEDKAFVTSRLGDPTPERARSTRKALVTLWHRLPELSSGH